MLTIEMVLCFYVVLLVVLALIAFYTQNSVNNIIDELIYEETVSSIQSDVLKKVAEHDYVLFTKFCNEVSDQRKEEFEYVLMLREGKSNKKGCKSSEMQP